MKAAYLDKYINSVKEDFNGDDAEKSNKLKEFIFNFDEDVYGLKCSFNDKQIKRLAETITGRIEYAFCNIQHIGRVNLVKLMQKMCLMIGVKYPETFDLDGIVARLICVKWWTKKLRIAHARKIEISKIQGGEVNRNKELYCSDATLSRRVNQLKRNAELIESVKIQNESGYTMTLAEAAAAGMANPHNRVSELLTRVKGFGEIAEKNKHICLFMTWTAPSKYHAMTYNKKTNKSHKNKHYQGFTPAETQKYLTGQWAKCRARLAREGVRFYGLRVVEPHHDGTPHWHGSIWFKTEGDLAKFRRAVKDYFLRAKECDYNERGAVSNRLKFKRCDERGAVGYMLKYILKNMKARSADGLSDEGSLTSADGAERVEAWATTWAIRQFQQIGGHSVTVWRELRRVDEKELISRQDATQNELENLMKAWTAAQKVADRKANFADFIEAMGGIETKPKDSLVKLSDEYIVSEGQYGKSIIHKIHGVFDVLTNWAVANNRQKWIVL